MQRILASTGIPTPPATPPFEQKCKQQLQQRPPFLPQRQLPVAPEDRIGSFLGNGSLQLTGIIGTGAYGVVYAAVDVNTQTPYAVKALSKLNVDGSPLEARQIDYQTREIRLHYQASAHPNVVSMYKIYDGYPDCLFVVLEYCPEGDLFYNITECGHFVGKDELARSLFLQIVDAVQFLHQAGIYHRDLKPENILVTDQGNTVKLADFGLATSSDRSEDYGCGSTFYMSPECLGQTNATRPFYYCAPNDVWSLGVILVNLTCGRNPWKQASQDDATYRAYTRNARFLKTILPLTDELNDILARIFTADPDQRIGLAELKDRILACPRFTVPPPPPPSATPSMPTPPPVLSPEPVIPTEIPMPPDPAMSPEPVIPTMIPMPPDPALEPVPTVAVVQQVAVTLAPGTLAPVPALMPLTPPASPGASDFAVFDEEDEFEEEEAFEDALQADDDAGEFRYHLPLSPVASDDEGDEGDDFYSTMGDNDSEASFASAAQLPATPPPLAPGEEDALMVGGGAGELTQQQQQQQQQQQALQLQLEQQVQAAAAGVAAAAAAFQYQLPPNPMPYAGPHLAYAVPPGPVPAPAPPQQQQQQYLQSQQQLPLPSPPQTTANRFFPGVLGWMGMVGRNHCLAQHQQHVLQQHLQHQQAQQQANQHYYMHHHMPMFHPVFLPN